MERIDPDFVKNCRDKIFIYGNNLLDRGEEGHRIWYSKFPNCIGLPTKKKPCHRDDSFMYDREFKENVMMIRDTWLSYPRIKSGVPIIVIPGIGREEDESLLYFHAPLTYHWLMGFLDGITNRHIIC